MDYHKVVVATALMALATLIVLGLRSMFRRLPAVMATMDTTEAGIALGMHALIGLISGAVVLSFVIGAIDVLFFDGRIRTVIESW